MPGVGDQQHGAPAAQRLDQLGGPRGLVVLVVATRPGRSSSTPRAAGEPAQPPGVLGGDHVGPGEQPAQPGRRVPGSPIGVAASTRPAPPASGMPDPPQPPPPAGHGGPRWRGASSPATDASAAGGTGPALTTIARVGTPAARTPRRRRCEDRPAASALGTCPPRGDPGRRAPAARRRRRRTGSGAGRGRSLVTVVGGFLRFWHLDRPHELVFDETYYVKQALLATCSYGYELGLDRPADVDPTVHQAATSTSSRTTPDFVVHPPVGKWMIAAGEWLFGLDSSFGWRFSAAAGRHAGRC